MESRPVSRWPHFPTWELTISSATMKTMWGGEASADVTSRSTRKAAGCGMSAAAEPQHCSIRGNFLSLRLLFAFTTRRHCCSRRGNRYIAGRHSVRFLATFPNWNTRDFCIQCHTLRLGTLMIQSLIREGENSWRFRANKLCDSSPGINFVLYILINFRFLICWATR
jgi:hypothetical protein